MGIPKRIKVVYKKLLNRGAYGLSHGKGCVEIDSRLRGRKHMEILIHECLHELFPDKEEKEIEVKAATLTRTMWYEKYRRIDDHAKDPLQDAK